MGEGAVSQGAAVKVWLAIFVVFCALVGWRLVRDPGVDGWLNAAAGMVLIVAAVVGAIMWATMQITD